MKKRTTVFIFALIAVVVLTFCIFLTSAAKTTSPQDIDAIRNAIIGAEEVQVQMGMFSSEDGLTSSLSEAELEALATEFDNKVDLYYAQDTYCNEFYKWLNRDYLFRVYQTTIDNCIAGGVSQCDITNITFSEDGTEATVKATVTTWNKWVTLEEDGQYTIFSPVCQDFVELKMTKEDSVWKLKETLSLDLGPRGYDPDLLTQASATANNASLAQDNNSDVEKNQILSEIKQSEEILSRKYTTFQEAKTAVQQIDVETGNYLALLQ